MPVQQSQTRTNPGHPGHVVPELETRHPGLRRACAQRAESETVLLGLFTGEARGLLGSNSLKKKVKGHKLGSMTSRQGQRGGMFLPSVGCTQRPVTQVPRL